MPNWACANYVASGDRVELEELVRTLNTMPNLLPDTPSGFGRYWLGNLFGAFGMTLEQIESSGISCRGTFDPDFCAVACLCGPDVDESSEFCLSDDGRLRFSTISAWDKCDDVDSLIFERFPSVSLAWSVTDEFGNFHYTHNPDGLTELPAFALNGLLYSEDDLDELAGGLRALIDVPEGVPGNLMNVLTGVYSQMTMGVVARAVFNWASLLWFFRKYEHVFASVPLGYCGVSCFLYRQQMFGLFNASLRYLHSAQFLISWPSSIALA